MSYPPKTQQAIEKGVREMIETDPKGAAMYFQLEGIKTALEQIKDVLRIHMNKQS